MFDGAHCREEGCQKSGGSEAETIAIDVNCMGSESVCYAQFQLQKSVSGGGGAFLSTCLLNSGSEMEAMCMLYTEHACF